MKTLTLVSPYKFAMLNNPQNSHLQKIRISPASRIHFYYNLWVWKEYISEYISKNFNAIRIVNFGDTTESISDIYVEEIGKLGLTVLGDSHHYFQKRITLDGFP